jgi:hypothetical protein
MFFNYAEDRVLEWSSNHGVGSGDLRERLKGNGKSLSQVPFYVFGSGRISQQTPQA